MIAPYWARVAPQDVVRITGRLYLTRGDRTRNLSAFAVLLLLAGVIAAAGVVADSTATVIGAMIVAPLMTPILGTATALVLANRRQIAHSIALTVGGAVAVIVIGYVLGMITHIDVVSATNSQVSSRVSPRLIDLLAALATGAVGAFALIRSDVSDTLPGVAIAISLVPPLAVVGLTAQSGAWDEAGGALLLFGTNVTAIIFTGVLMLLAAGMRTAAVDAGEHVGTMGRFTLLVVVGSVAALISPLAAGTWQVVRQQVVLTSARPVAEGWAESAGYQLTDLSMSQGILDITVVGASPEVDDAALRSGLDDAGLQDVTVDVTVVVGNSETLPAD